MHKVIKKLFFLPSTVPSGQHLDGEAGRVLAAGAGAVGSRPEGGGAGTLGRVDHVVVYPLTPLHQQVGQGGVQGDVGVVGEEHLLGHLPHLQPQNKQTKPKQPHVGAPAAARLDDEWLQGYRPEAGWRCGRCVGGPSL